MLDSFRQGLTTWKDAVGTINGLITIAAIFVSGYWSYRLFIRRRLGYPRADITQTVTHRHLPDGKVFIRATVTISNKGESLLTIEQGFTRFLLVAPYDADGYKELYGERTSDQSRIDWHTCGKVWYCPKEPREIEPGETDEIHFDFIYDDWPRTIIAFTCFENPKKKRKAFVWDKATLYDLKQDHSAGTLGGGKVKQDGVNSGPASNSKLTGLQARVGREPIQVKPMASANSKSSGQSGITKPTSSPSLTGSPGDGKVQTVVDQEPKPVTPPKQK